MVCKNVLDPGFLVDTAVDDEAINTFINNHILKFLTVLIFLTHSNLNSFLFFQKTKKFQKLCKFIY